MGGGAYANEEHAEMRADDERTQRMRGVRERMSVRAWSFHLLSWKISVVMLMYIATDINMHMYN